jgi:hypothetical protein
MKEKINIKTQKSNQNLGLQIQKFSRRTNKFQNDSTMKKFSQILRMAI